MTVLLAYLAPNPRLLDQLRRWLEVVHVQPQHRVQLVERFKLGRCVVLAVTDRRSHDGVVLLLDEAVVVLAVRPASGERDLVLTAVAEQVVADELAPVLHTEQTAIGRATFLGRE